MSSPFLRLVPFVVALSAVACAEKLEGDSGCPVLCPGQDLELRDTTLDVSISIDTTMAGYPPRGTGVYLLAANSGDTLDARVVVRFDSLGRSYVNTAGDTIAIAEIDSTRVRIWVDSALSHATAPVTFEVYDVDSEAADEDTDALIPLFRADRLLGTTTVEAAALKDTIDIDLSNAAVLGKIAADARLRLGFRVDSPDPVRVAVFSANTANFPRLRYDGAPAPADSQIGVLILRPRSRTPADDPQRALDFFDYTVVATGSPSLPSDVLGVGGARGRRTYFRFDLPARLTDSTSIVRASLVLTQRPAPSYGFGDTLLIIPNVVLASAEIADLGKAALVTDTSVTGVSAFGLPPVRFAPQDSAERRIELVNVARFWRSESKERVPQAIVLRAFAEGRTPIELHFFSSGAADPSVRPRLRIVYVPRTEFGIP